MLGYHRSANRYIGALDSSNEPRAPSWQHGVGTTVNNAVDGFGDLEGVWGTLMRGAKGVAKSAIPRLPGLPKFPMVHKGFHKGRPPGAHGNTGPGAAGMPGKDPPEGGFRRGGKNFARKPTAGLYTHHLRHAGVKTRKHRGFVPRIHPQKQNMLGDPMLSDPMLSGLSGPYTSTVTTFGGALDDVVSGAGALVDAANAKAEKLQNALYLIIGLSGIAALTGVVTTFRRR